ncbi:MAG: hypothetical protein L6W00_08675 [Lentisphaeria bacterium]|nr:MAG: hypothetical protein L6W00_08675 [Lentisphaeria bacterium]
MPSEKVREPGRKKARGFFSIGSICTAAGRHQVSASSRPPELRRTPQYPHLPGAIRQLRGQRVQRSCSASSRR